MSGVASSRSLFYITGDLLLATNINDPGVFLYQTTPTSILTASLDSTQGVSFLTFTVVNCSGFTKYYES